MLPQRPYILIQLESFIHEQLTPTKFVRISHNKGKFHPKVILTESNGTEFDAQISSVDENTIEVSLNDSIPFTVYIY